MQGTDAVLIDCEACEVQFCDANSPFKDSLQFLGSSLATLAKNLLKMGLESFNHHSRMFIGVEAWEFRLLVRKGVYLYEYLDCWENMDEEQIPPRRRSPRS